MSARPTSAWLSRASVIAMGTVLVATAPVARAQSFNAGNTVVAGSASVTTGAGVTDITIFSPQVVIDWTPTDTAIGGGAIDFQSAGTTATFTNNISQSNFAVLNRIVPVDPSRPVQFNGTVNGRISFPSAPTVTGGSVYFYSPGGIILGSNARMDVGALGLSTAPPVFDPSTGDFINNNSVTYTTAVDGTAVVINSGAQITAPVDQNSYVALFAPVIRQDGLIDVNGSTALVAGGAGTLTWNGGLFDVQVTVGTDGDGSGTAIAHGGNTGGALASGGSTDLHRVYMVAVPKNNAITTMIASGSTLGFDIAGAADTFGNSVILSAGFDQAGDIQVPSAGAGAGAANVTVTNSNITSNLVVNAKGTGIVQAVSGGVTALASDALVQGGIEARMQSIGSGSSLAVSRNLTLAAANNGDTSSPSVTGGNAILISDGGASFTVGGSAFLDASAFSDAFSQAGNATGGTALVNVANGGSLSLAGDLFANADGSGSGNGPMGIGTGGLAEVLVDGSGAAMNVGGMLLLSARGNGGGQDGGRSGFAGGDGFGGIARLTAQGGNNITVQGQVDLAADGRGGDGNLDRSGNGTGGQAFVSAGTGSMLDFRSGVRLTALGESGFGFNASDGGDGIGGSAALGSTGAGAVIQIGANLSLDVSGTSDGTFSFTGNGGVGRGGSASLTGQQGSITVASLTTLVADGNGGAGVTRNDGFGGNIIVNFQGNASLAANAGLDLRAIGKGATDFGSGFTGSGTGGTISLTTANNSSITVVSALSLGGDGFAGVSTGAKNPGSGQGGTVGISQFDAGRLTVTGSAFLTANGFGGDAFTDGSAPATGGSGTGGTASIQVNGTNDIRISTITSVEARGEGGIGFGSAGIANGGSALGGTARILTVGTGAVRIDDAVEVDASAFGGNAMDDGAGGSATGGQAMVRASVGGSVIINAPATGLIVTADAIGGRGSGSGPGGSAFGGFAELSALGGTLSANSPTFLLAGGRGGSAVNGAGGDAAAGKLDIIVDADALNRRGALSFGNLFGFSDATGGVGNTVGASYFRGGPVLSVQHGSLAGGDLQLLMAGSAPLPLVPVPAGRLFLLDSMVNISGNALIQTPGALSVFADSASLTAASLSLVAGGFVPDAAGAPASPGTLSAGSIAILSGNNIILGANLDSTASSINLTANGFISALGLTSVGDILAFAPGAIALGDLDSGAAVDVDSSSGAVTISKARAATGLSINSGASIVAGPIQAGQGVDVHAVGDAGFQAVTAGTFARLSSQQGLLGIAGMVSAPVIELGSTDITIGAAGGLDAGATGTTRIFGVNSAGMRIGDGVTGGGYLLDNSELSRIRTGSLLIAAMDVSNLSVDMRIGDLDVAGPLVSGSTIGVPDGSVTFFTGDIRAQAPSGTIRVVGSLKARGFGAANALAFEDATTEVDAETGLIEILGTSSDLAGSMEFLGRRLHVAPAATLDRLQLDPFYVGRVEDLNRPLATPRPDGVLRAFEIGTDNEEAVLIQNTGTQFLPAGILVSADGPIDFSSSPAPGSIEFIVNGQIMTPSGLLTGADAYAFLVDDSNRAVFSADSTINGCAVSVATCISAQPPQDFTQADTFAFLDTDTDTATDTASVSSVVSADPEPAADEPASEEERKAEEEGAEAGKRAPIPPPAPLINTRPLDPPVNVEEPVAGSGNPALIGGGQP